MKEPHQGYINLSCRYIYSYLLLSAQTALMPTCSWEDTDHPRLLSKGRQANDELNLDSLRTANLNMLFNA
jgi:hypothetical protein